MAWAAGSLWQQQVRALKPGASLSETSAPHLCWLEGGREQQHGGDGRQGSVRSCHGGGVGAIEGAVQGKMLRMDSAVHKICFDSSLWPEFLPGWANLVISEVC